jgi:ABC-type sugar transport system permease subunit
VQGFQQFATSYAGAMAFVSIMVTVVLVFVLTRFAPVTR